MLYVIKEGIYRNPIFPDDPCFQYVVQYMYDEDYISRKNINEYLRIPNNSEKKEGKNFIFAVLHEIGHNKKYIESSEIERKNRLISSKRYKENMYCDSLRLDDEIYSWLYAFSCVKPKYYRKLYKYAKCKFSSYLDRNNRDFPKNKKYWLKKFKKLVREKIKN